MNNLEKYFISDSYPIFGENEFEEIIVSNKNEDEYSLDMIYMPWQMIENVDFNMIRYEKKI